MYRNDPKVMDSRFAGVCSKCGRSFVKGAKIFYYPIGKRVLGPCCAEQAIRDFEASCQDEAFNGCL